MDITLDIDAVGRVLSERPAIEALEDKAGKVVGEAKADGPRAQHKGGHQIDLLEVGDTHDSDFGAAVDIDWPTSFWHLVEFGSVNNAPGRPVSRAAENNGLKIIDHRS